MSAFPIPVSVLTGFLGAGKTTLLNRMLSSPALVDTAVIVNEFGEVGIDHLLVEQSSDGVIELADGCLCCTVRGDLVETLADLVDRVQLGRIPSLRRVVIETTGLADPAPVMQAIMGHPILVQAYRLDGVITVVDAVNGNAALDAHVEAVKQAAVADRLVVTKTDLVEEPVAAALDHRLRALNPSAVLLRSSEAAPERLLDAGLYDPSARSPDVCRWLGEAHAYAAGGHAGHAHAHGHDSRVSALSLVHPGQLRFADVESFLDLLVSLHGEKLLRLKGVIELAERPERPLVVHGVKTLLHPPAFLPEWPDQVRGTRLMLITLDLDETLVRRLFASVIGAPAVDTPDRAATLHNPLAIPGLP